VAEKPTYKELEKRIQEFKLSEKALLESEHKLKIHIQDTPVGVISWDLDFKAVEWNPAAEVIFAYTKAEALGKYATELILPEDMKGLVDDIFNDLISQKGGVRSTNENITKEGKQIICDWYNTTLKDVDGNVIGVGSLVQDVTDRKRMEKAWRESEEFLNQTGDMAKVGGWQLDLETQKVIWTQTTGRIHELPDGFVPDLDEAINFYHPDDREAVTKFINQAIEAGKSFDFEVRLITANGKQRWIRALGQPTMKAGKCVRLLGTFQDITERKQAEEQLLEKEETLKVITESTNDTIIIMNNKGIITFWNTAASNLLGYSKEEALGENLHELIVPERFLNAHLSAFPQFIKTGKGNAIGTTLEVYAIGKDHIEIPIELSLSSIMIKGEWFAVGIIRDNTERKKWRKNFVNWPPSIPSPISTIVVTSWIWP
jgi:PAS domain S-box-containing protein